MNDYDYQVNSNDYQVNSNFQHPDLVVLEPSGQQEERTHITTYILKCSENETVSEIEIEADSVMRDKNMLISSCCILISLPSPFLIELFTTLSEIWNCNEGLELPPWNDKLTFLHWYMKEMTSYNREDCGIINNTEHLQKYLEEYKVPRELNKKLSGKTLQQISSQKKQARQKVNKNNHHMIKSNAKRFTYRYLN